VRFEPGVLLDHLRELLHVSASATFGEHSGNEGLGRIYKLVERLGQSAGIHGVVPPDDGDAEVLDEAIDDGGVLVRVIICEGPPRNTRIGGYIVGSDRLESV